MQKCLNYIFIFLLAIGISLPEEVLAKVKGVSKTNLQTKKPAVKRARAKTKSVKVRRQRTKKAVAPKRTRVKKQSRATRKTHAPRPRKLSRKEQLRLEKVAQERLRQEQIQEAERLRQQQAAEAERQRQAERLRQQQAAEAERQRQAEQLRQQQAAEAERQRQAERLRQQQAAEAERQRQAERLRQQQAAETERQRQAEQLRQQQAIAAEREREEAERAENLRLVAEFQRREKIEEERRRQQAQDVERQQQEELQRQLAERIQQQVEDANRQRQEEERQRQAAIMAEQQRVAQEAERNERVRQLEEEHRLQRQAEEAERQRQEVAVAEAAERVRIANERMRQLEEEHRLQRQAEEVERRRQVALAEERDRQQRQEEAERVRQAQIAEAAAHQRQVEAEQRRQAEAAQLLQQEVAEAALQRQAELQRAEEERLRQQQAVGVERQRQQQAEDEEIAREIAAIEAVYNQQQQRAVPVPQNLQPQAVNPVPQNPQPEVIAPLPEDQNFNAFTQQYIAPLRQKINASITLGEYFTQPLQRLCEGVGEIKLREAIAKQLKFKIELWEKKLQKEGRTDANAYALFTDVLSYNQMIQKVLPKADDPTDNLIPQKVQINPWMINSPYLDLLYNNQNAKVNIENIDAEPDQEVLKRALTKIGDLYDRLRGENKIKRLDLFDYEDVFDELKRDYANESEYIRNRYNKFLAYYDYRDEAAEKFRRDNEPALLRAEAKWRLEDAQRNLEIERTPHGKERVRLERQRMEAHLAIAERRNHINYRFKGFHPFANKAHLIGGPTGDIIGNNEPEIRLGVFNQTVRAKNRAIALANYFIWRPNEEGEDVQKVSDEEAARIFAVLAIAGRHCPDRAEIDTNWAVQQCSPNAITESKETLEYRVAYFVDRLKQNAIKAMVGEEEIKADAIRRAAIQNGRNPDDPGLPRAASQAAHLPQLIQKRLAPYIGFSPGDLNTDDQTHFFREYENRPLAEILTSFNQKLTAELLIDELVRDNMIAMSRDPANAIIKLQHYEDFVDDVMPEGQRTLQAAGIMTEDEDSPIGYTFTRDNAKNLLLRVGYLKEED